MNERALEDELRIEVPLRRGLTNLPALLPLAGIDPLGIEKHSGLVTVVAIRLPPAPPDGDGVGMPISWPPTKCGCVERGAQRTDIL